MAGKYELESILGEGGMGAVWRARNMALDARVAIKVLRASGDRAVLRARLLQEARAAAKLSHPAIVKVFDVGQTESGDPFIVMELLTGSSLGTLLAQQGRLPGTQAVRILLPIVDALWFAHGKSIVHRDLKPDNVFIAQDEAAVQPKLVDFGIVKVEQREHDGQLTQDGVVLGSPDYMSPEQARGQDDVDHRSDVWGLCVVLYEVIAGHPPFKGSNYNALMRQIVEATPPTLRELAVADEQLSAIVARGLSKQRAERFESMGELGRALATWLLSHGVNEDICGTTLEAKWLRGTDPQGRPMRASLISLTDAWPSEGGSGIRPHGLLPATTLPAPAPPAPAPALVSARRLRWSALAAAGAGGVAWLAWWLGGNGPQIAPPPATSAIPLVAASAPPVSLEPQPLRLADLPIEAAPAEEPALVPSGKVSSPPVRGTAKRLPVGSRPAPPAAGSGKVEPDGRGDLISPY